jgi:hypothetical protein
MRTFRGAIVELEIYVQARFMETSPRALACRVGYATSIAYKCEAWK